MKSLTKTGLFVVFVFCIFGNLWAEYRPGEILVKFKPNVTKTFLETQTGKVHQKNFESRISGINKRRGIGKTPKNKWLGMARIAKLKYDDTEDIFKIIEKYRNDPDVEYAEPNHIRRASVPVPNDVQYYDQWALKTIMANYAWDIEKGDTTIIAVVDTGVDTDHPDLQAHIIPGYDCRNEDSDPDDDNGHGTHVAGIIGAVTNNNQGVAGVCWNCQIMPVKVIRADGQEGTAADLIQGIIYAADHGARIINMSLGGPGYNQFEQDAVDAAYNSGCLLIAAAGNEGTDETPSYPACYRNCISVAATNQDDYRAYFSNYGDSVDLCAPGVSILSTMPNHYVYMNGEGYSPDYENMSGTSMATPFVSGVAALIFAKNPTYRNTQVEEVLFRSVDDLGALGKDIYYGYGRINALKAMGATYLTIVNPIKIYTYPNPLRIPQSTTITIKDIPIPMGTASYFRIYNIAGELVREFEEADINISAGLDYAYIGWDAKNDAGEFVSAGVYLAVVSDGTRVAVEKIVVLK